ncbi:predicted protein [Nematostella vectensis]|uniref:EF-hand domain-containing protein n=1 Tax=Nematostella vectensis TaxID=45351 RepID=A8DVR3_NEMVE|nr:predicted protein [Nematostella vectensis]|eukprot:XP_001617796.1 hypothetical protein NEMVEDRAFT_v1g225785 [Nematostella vectensis]
MGCPSCVMTAPKPTLELSLSMTTEFTEDELQKWFAAFKNNCPKGKMSQSKFCEMYAKSYKTGDASIFAGHVFRTFDKNNDGTIDFNEFIQGLSIISRGSKETKLRWAFEIYDSDGSGEVSKKEMLEIVRSIFRLAGEEVTAKLPRDENTPEKFTSKLFLKLDGDKSGSINQTEFIRGAQCYPSFMKLLENPASVR